MPSRVERSVDHVLGLLSRRQVKGTFFTLGWVAKRHPHVARCIVAAGHEIASHGWWHQKVTTLSPSKFREDVRLAKDVLEDITGQRVLGYRAPSFSIVPGGEWAFDVLIEEGYVYDSSLFPVRRTGIRLSRRDPHCPRDRPTERPTVRVSIGDDGPGTGSGSRRRRGLPPALPVQRRAAGRSESTTRRNSPRCSTFTRGN